MPSCKVPFFFKAKDKYLILIILLFLHKFKNNVSFIQAETLLLVYKNHYFK